MPMRTTRIAGRFFPEDKDRLSDMLRAFAARTEPLAKVLAAPPRAVIVPHAGYGFCGGLTAGAWAVTRGLRPARIAVLSPSHHHGFDGIAVPCGHGAVGLPGMRVRIDTEACKALVRSRKARAREAAFETEHGIDTQLPFARQTHPRVPVVPVVIGTATAGQVAAVIDRLARMQGETLFVLSSDLSHFLTREQALRIDAQTAGLIETGQGARLTPAHACGARAIAGWLASEAGRDGRVLRLGQASSFSATQDAARVVGYGAWAFYDPATEVLSAALRRELLRAARQALTSRLTRGRMPEVKLDSFPVPLRTVAASFVTLEIDGRLRGCIGSMTAHRALVADVVANAVRAAVADRRFEPLTPQALDAAEIRVSVLSRPRQIACADEAELLAQLVPGETGLILAEGDRRALFLPSVWSGLPDPAAFVRALRRKAGLDPERWSAAQEFRLFHAESFAESDLQMREAA